MSKKLSSNREIKVDVEKIVNPELGISDLWEITYKKKWTIIAITAFFAIISVCVALLLPNEYRARATLAPAASEQAGGLSSLAGQFGGIAAIAGINLNGGGSVDKTILTMEVLKSREFITNFIRENELLVPLMASKGWDRVRNKLIIDSDIYDNSRNKWVRKPVPPRTEKPSDLEAIERFLEIFSVNQNKKTSLISISIDFYSPILAKEWVDMIIRDINSEMKFRDLAEAEKSIKYLERKIRETSLSEMKAVLFQLVEEQSKTMMFAEVRDEYVLKTIDPAVVPELKVKPKRAIICILGTILGFLIAVFGVLVRHFSSQAKATEE